MLSIIINGAIGKAGRMLAECAADADVLVAAGVDPFAVGQTASFPLFESFSACKVKADVLIDFSAPAALESVLKFGLSTGTPLVIATTGLSAEQHKAIDDAARTLPIFQCANMSLGVNVMADLLRMSAIALSDRFDIEIIEKHHNGKADAPSGTALMLANEIQKLKLHQYRCVFGREGVAARREKFDMGIHAVRGGTVAGEHEVLFLGPDEVLSIKHTAMSRRIFALGALKAAAYVCGKPAGRYEMKDMLTEQAAVQFMRVEHGQTMLSVRGIPHGPADLAAIFQAIGAASVNVDMISQTAPAQGFIDVSFTLPLCDVERACAALNEAACGHFTQLERQDGLVKLAVEGTGMERQPGIAGRVFERLASQKVPVYLVTTSETQITVCLPETFEKAATSALQEAFSL